MEWKTIVVMAMHQGLMGKTIGSNVWAIAIDAPEDLELGSQNPSALQTLAVSGGIVAMNYHSLGVAIVQLAAQYDREGGGEGD
jgi:hypothetical protein